MKVIEYFAFYATAYKRVLRNINFIACFMKLLTNQDVNGKQANWSAQNRLTISAKFLQLQLLNRREGKRSANSVLLLHYVLAYLQK